MSSKYPIDQSPFYKLQSRKKLASLLYLDPATLSAFSTNSDKHYKCFTHKKTGRLIQEPKHKLKVVHQRILKLLSRIQTPPFLHSALKGRSYQSNAEEHIKNFDHSLVKIDIASFFQSVRWYRIYLFFNSTLKCSPDVSKIISDLVTYEDKLPTGSCLSPLLSYFSNSQMFEEINSYVDSSGSIMTLYMDDIAVSGSGAGEKLLSRINSIIHRYGYVGHKKKRYEAGESKLVTGLIVSRSKIRAPFSRIRKLHEDLNKLPQVTDDAKRLKFLKSLVGRLQEICKFEPRYLNTRDRITREYYALEARVARLQQRKTCTDFQMAL